MNPPNDKAGVVGCTLENVVQQIESCGLHKRTPYAIANVSMTQFSVARYAGACKYNGEHYIYWPHHDLLVRDDVHRFLLKAMKKKKPADGTGSLLNPKVTLDAHSASVRSEETP